MNIPSGLNAHGSDFWAKVMSDFDLTESHDLERLSMACRCLDDIEVAENQVVVDGMFIKDRYGSTREHPACKVIRDNRIIFCRIIRELGLDLDPAPDNRPRRRY